MNFPELKVLHDLKSSNQTIIPRIDARMDKNLMWVDGQWTCYRRNYITIQVHYTLDPNIVEMPLHVDIGDGRGLRMVKALGVSLAATMDEERGKPIGLIQHTAKRDRGPQLEVTIAKLPPLSPQSQMPPYHGTCRTNGPILPLQQDGDHQNATIPPQGQHTFERIQFKQATANNGRRRAQQQFYHIMVELHADLRERATDKEDWHKVAHKMSDAMVVRGRSPGHYKDSPNSSGQSSGNAGGSGAAPFGYSSLSHGTLRYGSSMRSQGRNSMNGNGSGSYRGHQCMTGSHSNLLATPTQSYSAPLRKMHTAPEMPVLFSSDTYGSLNNDEPYRPLYSPVVYDSSVNSRPQSLVKPEVPASPAPLITGSCGSEEPTMAQIYTPPWTMTTCNRIPLDSRSGFASPEFGSTY